MTTLDWLVIGAYMAGMLAIGAYYARRNRSEEDYLLGGREMGATALGLSLFAALLSTISCLAVPGEVIKHGPMLFADMISYPLVYWLIGWFIIPYFVKLRAVTAYEILEERFGVGVRLFGSLLWLAMRFIWMGVIVYATTSQVLIPLTGLPEWSTPWACVVIGAVTVVYTSIGGLRAVVVTDVIQESILIGGVVLALVIITLDLGGVSAWWPDQWMTHWDELEFGLGSGSRVNIPIAILQGMLWWICTAGSDQIAIQRYLSARDIPTARRLLAISFIASTVSLLLLAFVGLAILAFFQRHPELLAPGTSVDRDSDRLFARFIDVGFPPGLTGLIIAGLLATAMSSLSSGINSACSVITVDLINRWKRSRGEPGEQIDHTKAISWGVGIVVVVASTLVGSIEGNLLEVVFKAVNLLVGPIALLFFMAIFIPWATSLGAIVASTAGLVVAVGMNYYGWFGLSFIWALPLSLLAGMIVGPVASFLPLKRRAVSGGALDFPAKATPGD